MDAGEGPGGLLPVHIQVKMVLMMVMKVMVLRFIECSLRTRTSPPVHIQVMRISSPTRTVLKILTMNKMMERRWMVLMMKKIEVEVY